MDSGPNRNGAAGGSAASGGESSDATGGGSSGGAGGATTMGGAGAFAVGGAIAIGGAVAVGGTTAGGGENSAGLTGSGGDICGPGGCLEDTGAPAVVPPGPVLCGGTVCEAPRACCFGTGECYDPSASPDACTRPTPDSDTWGRKTCASNAQCGPRQFCKMDSGLCQGTGHCNPIGNCGSCFGGSACRVCGCDGNTYPDVQTACLASANVVSVSGAGCGEPTDMDGGRGAGGGASDAGVPRPVTLCGSSGDCGTGETCCAITGFCFPTSEPARCQMPPPGTRLPCTSDAQCSSYEYCLGDGCSGPGGCVSFGSESDCGVTFELVCGCDGVMYTSPACASSRGVRVASKGECVAN